MPGSSTSSNDAISDACAQAASLLNFEMYVRQNGNIPDALRDQFDAAKERWMLKWEIKKSDDFLCRFYVPCDGKSSGPNASDPPVLVFRGSDQTAEEIAQIALGLRLELSFELESPVGPARWVQHKVIDTCIGAGDLMGRPVAEVQQLLPLREELFDNLTGEKTVQVGGWKWARAGMTVKWTASSALFYGSDGDWATHIAQGLGQVPDHYKMAGVAGLRAADEARQKWDNRLIITGHALGGGLAAAAGIQIEAQHDDMVITCDTYNAAGLHDATAKALGGDLSMGSDIPINARYVEGEILSTLQARSRTLPFISDALVWGGKSLTPAIANLDGVSVRAGTDLQVLFGLDDQTYLEPFEILNQYAALARTSQDPNQFIDRLIDHVFGVLGQEDVVTYSEVMRILQVAGGVTGFDDAGHQLDQTDLIDPFMHNLKKELHMLGQLLSRSAQFHTFETCAGVFYPRK